jgi:hypothetical protein
MRTQRICALKAEENHGAGNYPLTPSAAPLLVVEANSQGYLSCSYS